jgi:hypothetical protein
VDALIEQLKDRAEAARWAPERSTPLDKPAFGDPLDGHPAIAYLRRNWTGPDAGRAAAASAGARWRRLVDAIPRRAMLPERELVTELASLTDALVQRCAQLSAEVDDLRAQLDRRARARESSDLRLAALLDELRRERGG